MKTRREALVIFGGTAAVIGIGADGWARGAAAPLTSDGLKRAAPSDIGVDPDAVLAFLDEAERLGLELNSFMLARRGAVAAEGWWWPYRSNVYHMLHSSTKSFVGAGVGIAIGEGLLRLDDPVLKFFPDRVVNPSANLQAMTVENLLTQTSGHAIGISGSQWRPIKTSWVTEFLKVPVDYAPGTRFAYSSATSFMLSAIITQITGAPLRDYLEPRLFEPMGIRNYHWDVGPENINPGGNGLSTTTADFSKLGLMLLAGGRWNDRQIVPADWAAAIGRPTHGNPYGYQWWVAPGDGGYFAGGKFGQVSIVVPALDAVLTMTAGVADNAATREKMQALAFGHLPKMCSEVGAKPPSDEKLRAMSANLRILPPLAASTSPLAKKIGGRMYRCADNADQVKAVGLRFEKGRALFSMHDHRGVHVVKNGTEEWLESETTITGGYLHHEYDPPKMRVVAGGRWLTENSYEMVWQFIETGFRDTATLTFEGDSVRYDRRTNVNSGDLERPTITGALSSLRQRESK